MCRRKIFRKFFVLLVLAPQPDTLWKTSDPLAHFSEIFWSPYPVPSEIENLKYLTGTSRTPVPLGTMIRSYRPLITAATETLEVTTSKSTTIETTHDPLTTTKSITAEKTTRIETTEMSEKTVKITQAEKFENEVYEVVENVENDLLFGGFGIAWIVTGLIIILSAIR